MLDIPLHAGTGHPDLTWIVITAIVSFAAGLGVASTERFRTLSNWRWNSESN